MATTVLVTGSAGYLGEALCKHLKSLSLYHVVGVDIRPSEHTTRVGDLFDNEFLRSIFEEYCNPSNRAEKIEEDEKAKEDRKSGISGIFHTAALHKPQVATNSRQRFIDANVSGTLNLLENAVKYSVESFIFTSTTSVFIALEKIPHTTLWITEESPLPPPKNIYALSKISCENLCYLMHQLHGLPILILRTSRFFPEEDDSPCEMRDENVKANEYLCRRVALQDVVGAHVAAFNKAKHLKFDTFIISAKTPIQEEDLKELRANYPSVTFADIVRKYYGTDFEETYKKLGWKMSDDIDRVYISRKAEKLLDFTPSYNFGEHLQALKDKAK